MENTFLPAVFAHSFKTFKALHHLTVAQAGETIGQSPKTIWQILQHLLIWQTHQLRALQGNPEGESVAESDTWLAARAPESAQALESAIGAWEQQLQGFAQFPSALRSDDPALAKKVALLQEASTHLSFHLGEIILLRRLQGSYPMPHQMKEFLQT